MKFEIGKTYGEGFEFNAVDPYFVSTQIPYPNKLDTLAEYHDCRDRGQVKTERARICYEVELSLEQWQIFIETLLDPRDWLYGKGGSSSFYKSDKTPFEMSPHELELWREQGYNDDCLLVYPDWEDGKEKDAIVVNPEGHDYARYVGLFPSTVETC